MEIGIDSFAAFLPESKHQAFVPASQRMADLLAEVETADRGGLAIIVGWQTRWVALALAGFSMLSALIFHNNFADQNEMANFRKISPSLAAFCSCLQMAQALGRSIIARLSKA